MMKKLLAVFLSAVLLSSGAFAADTSSRTARSAGEQSARNSIESNRANSIAARQTSTTRTTTARGAIPAATRAVAPVRAAAITASGTSRAPAVRSSVSVASPRAANTTAARSTVARAASDDAALVSNTRTGAEYERCKNSYFACMDQFCAIKDSNYQRCSCSDRVYDLKNTWSVLQDANDQINVFNENLDTVGMTAAQATAMRISSEGEDALTRDSSSSKALLQAIMNSIRGEDTNVGGRFSDLNSISIKLDSSALLGNSDPSQTIATYNGKNLYTAIYGQCRQAVRDDCNDASLQRAVTAYLMAVEQDCNTVAKAIDDNRKKLTGAVRESGAMLELARVEDRKTHNSSDMTACLREVEESIQSDQVCGANYYKCLDNGQYIDIKTGSPIVGVVDFYKLGEQLTFVDGAAISDQKLSKISSNRTFVQGFEAKTKKFAADALDKCREQADQVWADYLDKALLDIYYAQSAKVSEIRNGCMDFVSACYVNGDKALTDSMSGIMDKVLLTPDFITVNEIICQEYVASCNNMFANQNSGNIIADYLNEKTGTDVTAACRAVAQQCFDEFGGTGYVNYYNPYSGLFAKGFALDWFTLYDVDNYDESNPKYVSICAQRLADITSCSDKDMMEKVFGGFDKTGKCLKTVAGVSTYSDCLYPKYGQDKGADGFDTRGRRYTGVATEVYNKIIDSLTVQCNTTYGRFTEKAFLPPDMYNSANTCLSTFNLQNGHYEPLITDFRIGTLDAGLGLYDGLEDMCPNNYANTVDTSSWGACLCWENGGRRSDNGKMIQCSARIRGTNTEDFIDGFVNLNGKVCPKGMSKSRECCTDYAGTLTTDCATLNGPYSKMEYLPDAITN